MTETLKEQMALLKIKTADLAKDMGLEYGPVSTAIQMEAAGEVPKRQSVRDRIEAIRQHLTLALTVADRTGADEENPKRKAEVWDSPEEAARRFPACNGLTVTYPRFGERVRIDLDGQGMDVYRILRTVVNPRTGKVWVDVLGGETGGMRSVTLEELAAKRRVR